MIDYLCNLILFGEGIVPDRDLFETDLTALWC